MKKFVAICAALGLATAMAACGPEDEDNGGGGGGSSTSASMELFDTVLTEAFCDAIFDCFETSITAAELTPFFGRYSSVEECQQNIDVGSFSDEYIEQAIEAGRLFIHRNRADSCRTAIYNGFCNDTLGDELPEACSNFVEGRVAEGGACIDEFECEGALNCDYTESESQGICYGFCAPYVALGSTCGDEVCTADQYCDFDFDEDTFEFVDFCAERVDEGEECQWSEQCVEGLICSDLREICIPIERARSGESCTFLETICEPGTWCFPGEDPDFMADEVEGTCVAIGTQGEPCLMDLNCRFDLVCEDVDGEVYGSCEIFEPRAIGETCESSDECASGVCDWNIDECVAPKALGESCDFASQCESDSCSFSADAGESVCVDASEADICIHPDDVEEEEAGDDETGEEEELGDDL